MMRTDIAYGGAVEAERLRKLADGECLHSETLDIITHGDDRVQIICRDCTALVRVEWMR